MITYTNAQFRSIMFGLGYIAKDFADLAAGYPVTTDNSPLTGNKIVEGIRNFQADYRLLVDGIVGAKTMAKAQEVMKTLQYKLNVVVDAGLPKDQPYYGPKTVAAVKKLQSQMGVLPTGVANHALRVKLDELAKTDS